MQVNNCNLQVRLYFYQIFSLQMQDAHTCILDYIIKFQVKNPFSSLSHNKDFCSFFIAVASSIANGSSASSSTYIRSQYNLNPPPASLTMNMNHNISIHSGDPRLMDISLTSPEDLPPYDPSLTCTAPSDGPPSTIGMINSKKMNDILFPKLF